jgi:hypothetical protein
VHAAGFLLVGFLTWMPPAFYAGGSVFLYFVAGFFEVGILNFKVSSSISPLPGLPPFHRL